MSRISSPDCSEPASSDLLRMASGIGSKRRGALTRGLRHRWFRWWQNMGVPCPPAVDDLLERWQEPQRAYHTFGHLAHCLSVYDRCPYRDPLVELSLWFHYAVYDPRSAENELRSADLACQVMEAAGLLSTQREIVKRCILATRHRDPPGDDAEKLTLDVDLAILGSGRSRYARYEHGIRTEYAWVPLQDYRRERGRILQRFLTQGDLFHLPWFQRRFGAKVGGNLQWSLRHLETLHG